MNILFEALWNFVVHTWRAFLRGWDRFWFGPQDPTTLAVIRILTGTILFYIHATCVFRVLDFIGPQAWVDAQATAALRHADQLYPPGEQEYHKAYILSIFYWIQDPTTIYAIYFVFLAAILCFTFGFFTKTANVITWIVYVSYLQRGYIIWFGMDTVLCMLLLYLLVGPSGNALSIDRLLARYRMARDAIKARGRAVDVPDVAPNWLANVSIRLIQLNMCLIYFCSGCAKLQGNMWWSGGAVWFTMNIKEFEVVPAWWIGYAPDWVWQSISCFGVLFTLVFEIGFVFLIWNRAVRPFMLFSAFMLHGGIGLFMGLGGFAAAMLTGCSSFVYPESMRWFLSVLLKGPSGYRFVFDRLDPAHVRMVSWIRAADVYRQVEILEAHAAPAGVPVGTLVSPDGSTAQGLAAFARLVRVLRAFWIAWPVAAWSFVGAGKEELATVKV